MKKIFLMFLFIQTSLFGQEKSENKFQIELGTTVYGYNIAFSGFDIDFNIPFWKKGINQFSFKTSLMTLIPANAFHPKAPYILFGGLFELQYALSKKGFLFALETGLGVSSEFFQAQMYEEGKGFYTDYSGTPYGIFSSGLRIGYDFQEKFKKAFKLSLFAGYRMQFPYNLTIKHLILYGISLNYTFDFGGIQ